VPVEVVTWSRPDWNTAREWRSLEPHLSRLDPDLLLLAYCLNDAEPIDEGRRALFRATRRREPRGSVRLGLYRHSRLYASFFDALENRRLRRSLNTYYHALYEGEEARPLRWPLRKFAIVARHIPTVLIIFPIFDSELDHRYSYTDLHRKVGRWGRALNLPTLDLLDVYSGHDGRKLALAPYYDPHPSRLAHRIAAKAILSYLEDHQLLPHPGGTEDRASPANDSLSSRSRRTP
jgi:hypothetical protein